MSAFLDNVHKPLIVLNQMVGDGVIPGYAIGGAIGAFMYLEPTFTADIDVYAILGLGLDALSPIAAWLSEHGHEVKYDKEGFVIEGWAVQFIHPPSGLAQEALDEAIPFELQGVPTAVISQEHLMAMCLELGGLKFWSRLENFLNAQKYDESRFKSIISKHNLLGKWEKFNKVKSEAQE